jgi:hypothetical protein
MFAFEMRAVAGFLTVDFRETGSLQQLFEKGEIEHCEMLVCAKHEVVKSTPYGMIFFRPFWKAI